MILSHKHKFIFLKTNKTAGTSIEIALAKFCGEEDIITPITPEDEAIRTQLGYRGPQNFIVSPTHDSYKNWVSFRGGRFYNHMPAKKVKMLIGEKEWNQYYKFCFERNPWDRVVSFYFWVCNTGPRPTMSGFRTSGDLWNDALSLYYSLHYKVKPRPTISEFIASGAPTLLKKRGFEVYTINGEIAVDRVCRYEHLEEELDTVCNNQLHMSEKLVLPRAKGNYRKEKKHYRDVLSNDDKEKIAMMFSKEITLFGYEY